jgi:hypothetical protein
MLAKILVSAFLLSADVCMACKCREIPWLHPPPPAGTSLPDKEVRIRQAAWYSLRATTIVRATVLQREANIAPTRFVTKNEDTLAMKPEPFDTDRFTPKYKFLISEVLKGSDVIGERIIRVSHDSCGIAVNPGEEWIYFIDGDQPLHQCSGHLHLNMTLLTRAGRTEKDIDANTSYSQRILTALREAKTQEQLHTKNPVSRASTMPSNK